MRKRSALRPDLFAGQRRESKLDRLGDPLIALNKYIDFAALAAEVDRVAPRQHIGKNDKAALEKGEEPDWTPAQKRQRDTDASWTKKHGTSHFGYKLSASVDAKHKLIRKIETGTASEHDSQHFDAVLDAGNTGSKVYADRGYPSQAREAALKARGFTPMIQRKAQRNRALPERQKERNRRIATVRARVEHVFGSIAQMGGKLLRTIGQARADFAMTMMAVCYNLKRLTHLESVRSTGP